MAVTRRKMITRLTNKNLIYALTMLLLITGCSSETKDLDSTWDAYLQSLGSPEKIKELKTLYYETITPSDSGILKSNITLKYPDKVRNEFTKPNGSVETIIINGKAGIMILDNDTTQLAPDVFCRFEHSALIINELYFKELGYELVQVYSDNDKGRINILVKNNCIDLVYVFDEKTSKVLEVTANDYNFKSQPLEIKNMDGVNFITKVKFIQGNTSWTSVNKNYKLNLDVPDSIFEVKTATNKK